MNKDNFIKYSVIGEALEDMSCYKLDSYDSLASTSLTLYHFMYSTASKVTAKCFEERLFNYVLYNNEDALTLKEIDRICFYYGYGVRPLLEEYSEAVFEQFRDADRNNKAEIQRLVEATAELRKLDKGCYCIPILERIGDYIKYYERVRPIDRLALYILVYNIGYADGKRAERARRKARSAPKVTE